MQHQSRICASLLLGGILWEGAVLSGNYIVIFIALYAAMCGGLLLALWLGLRIRTRQDPVARRARKSRDSGALPGYLAAVSGRHR